MSQIIMAIAMLCGPVSPDVVASRVLDCQKYYIECISRGHPLGIELSLASCIMHKEKLGGPK